MEARKRLEKEKEKLLQEDPVALPSLLEVLMKSSEEEGEGGVKGAEPAA